MSVVARKNLLFLLYIKKFMGQKINPISHRLAVFRDWNSLWFKKKNKYGNWFLEDYYTKAHVTYFFTSFGIFISWMHCQRNNDVFFLFVSAWKETDSTFRSVEQDNEKNTLQYRLFSNKIIKYDHYFFFYKTKEIGVFPFFIKDLLLGLQGYLQTPVIFWVYPMEKFELVLSATSLLNYFVSRMNFSKLFANNKFQVLVQQVVFETCFNNEKIEGLKLQASGRIKIGQTIAQSEVFSFGRLSLHTYKSKIDFNQQIVNTKYGSVGLKMWLLVLFFVFCYVHGVDCINVYNFIYQ